MSGLYPTIRSDLAANGNLSADYADHPYTFGAVSQMAISNYSAYQMITNNWNRYQAATYGELNFSDFDTANYSEDGTNQTFRLWLRKTAMQVIRISY